MKINSNITLSKKSGTYLIYALFFFQALNGFTIMVNGSLNKYIMYTIFPLLITYLIVNNPSIKDTKEMKKFIPMYHTVTLFLCVMFIYHGITHGIIAKCFCLIQLYLTYKFNRLTR